MSLEATDEYRGLSSRHYAAVKDDLEPGFAGYFPASAKSDALSVIRKLGDRACDELAIMLFRQSEYCGGISARVSDIFAHTEELIAVDGDGLTVVSRDAQNGFCFDFSPNDPGESYEVVVWGELWPLRLLD